MINKLKLSQIIFLLCFLGSGCFVNANAAEDNFADSVSVSLKISQVNQHNLYLCMQNMGCLNLNTSNNGFTFHVLHDLPLDYIYLLNVKTRKIVNLGSPASCNGMVATNHRLAVYGKLRAAEQNSYFIDGLECKVS